MLIDGISLVDSSVIANTHIESGTAFPASASLGRMFFLNATVAGNEPGLYVYNGTAWVTGDITKITVGSGLTGGGAKGDISLGIDTNVVATKTYADSVAAVVQNNVDSLTKADIGLDLVENKSSATIRSEISSSNVTTALGFTPYNATNPSSYINLTQARQGMGAGTGISYDSATGFISLNATSSLIAEGTNKYFTDARARAAISATGSLAYNSTTGVISYTAPTSGSGSGDFKSDGSVAMTGALKIADGTAAAPSLVLGSLPGYGLFKNGASAISMATNGAAIFNFSASAAGSPTATIYGNNIWVNAFGDAANPAFTFTPEANTGVYGAAGLVGITTVGVKRFSINSTVAAFSVPVTLPADPTTALQAATKQYVDSKVSVMDGGTF